MCHYCGTCDDENAMCTRCERGLRAQVLAEALAGAVARDPLRPLVVVNRATLSEFLSLVTPTDDASPPQHAPRCPVNEGPDWFCTCGVGDAPDDARSQR